MKPLAPEDLLDLESYQRARDDYLEAIIAHKRQRRLAVGDCVTLLFEDRETLRFQVQEMLRVEHIRDPQAVQRELDVYNELMPGERELSATLFIEITDAPRIRPELDRLIGIDEHVVLRLGEGASAGEIPARFDPKQFEDDRISAVQYVRFPFTPEQVERFADPSVPARVHIHHPSYRREAALQGAMRESLVRDLRGEPPVLLDPTRGG